MKEIGGSEFHCKNDPLGWSLLLCQKSQMNNSYWVSMTLTHIPPIPLFFTLENRDSPNEVLCLGFAGVSLSASASDRL